MIVMLGESRILYLVCYFFKFQIMILILDVATFFIVEAKRQKMFITHSSLRFEFLLDF